MNSAMFRFSIIPILILSLSLLGLSGCPTKSSVEVDPPHQFTIIAADPTAPLEAKISWETSKGAATYKVSYGTTSGIYNTVVSENAESPLVVRGLSDGVTYYFKVSAENRVGTKSATNEISVTVYANLSLASISPAEGFFAGGQTVTLTGTGFQPGSTVQIAGLPCTAVHIVSATTLTCLTPNRLTAGSTNVTVTDTSGKTVSLTNGYAYKSDAFQKLELFAGSRSEIGHKNTTGTAAKFFRPTKPIIYNGYAYISDTNNHMIRRMNLTSKLVEDVAGQPFMQGTADGVGSAARFYYPMGMVLVGSDIFIADNGNCTIRKLNTITSAVTSIAGQGSPCVAVDNPNGALAGFGYLTSLNTDGSYLYVADDSGAIARVSLTSPYGSTALSITTDLVIDIVYLNNALYYTEYNYLFYRVNKFDLLTNTQSAIAGGNSSVDVDGTGAAARFSEMGGIETDGTDLYVSSTAANKIKRITLGTQVVTTIIGEGSRGQTDGLGTSATLNRPTGLFYVSGEIYFVSIGDSTIRKYNHSTTAVTTLAGGGQ